MYLPILWFVFLLIKMLKTLNEEIYPHHGGLTVAARDDNNIQTVGLHACNQTNNFLSIFLSFIYYQQKLKLNVICI